MITIAKKIAVTTLLAGVCVLASVSSSSARGLGGYAGRALYWSDNSCFAENWGSVTNNCSTAKEWRTFTSIDGAGNHSVWFNGRGATSANNVGCAAYGMTEDSGSYWGGSYSYLTTFGSAQQVSLGSVYVPGFGYQFVSCTMNNGGRLNSISWTP